MSRRARKLLRHRYAMMLLFGGHLGLKMCGNHAIMTFQPSKIFNLREFFCSTRTRTRIAPAAKLTVNSFVAHGTWIHRMSHKATSVATESHKGKVAGVKAKNQSRQPTTVTEVELRRQQNISPEDVLRLEKPTEGEKVAICPPPCDTKGWG